MKKLLATLIILAPLASCGPINSAGTIATVQLTTIQAATAVNDTYAALSTMGAALVQAGLLDKAKFKALDARAFAIVGQVRRAKEIGDTAFDYAGALQSIIALNKEMAS